ncbi:MAG: hypothetical protein L6R40_003188 [Gallowayella cf. fulva]|nr:MAG: hypothetical protein L6R40_003188 [Xanthomendoza cf. fulva]
MHDPFPISPPPLLVKAYWVFPPFLFTSTSSSSPPSPTISSAPMYRLSYPAASSQTSIPPLRAARNSTGTSMLSP